MLRRRLGIGLKVHRLSPGGPLRRTGGHSALRNNSLLEGTLLRAISLCLADGGIGGTPLTLLHGSCREIASNWS